MSKRLQVMLPDWEMAEIQRLAARQKLSVGEWVRGALREVRKNRSLMPPETKLEAVRRAAALSFDTADIEQILGEIERGYQG